MRRTMLPDSNHCDGDIDGASSERSFLLIITLSVVAELSCLIWWFL